MSRYRTRGKKTKARRALAEFLAHSTTKEDKMVETSPHVYYRIAEEVAKRHPGVTDETVRRVLDDLDDYDLKYGDTIVVPADGRAIIKPAIVLAVLAEAHTYGIEGC